MLQMKSYMAPMVLLIGLLPGSVKADELQNLQNRVNQLETDLKNLKQRFDNLGSGSAPRKVRIVDPVFIGEGVQKSNSLEMDNETINCPARSFITAVQILKTSNTVTQIRYACRQLD